MLERNTAIVCVGSGTMTFELVISIFRETRIGQVDA